MLEKLNIKILFIFGLGLIFLGTIIYEINITPKISGLYGKEPRYSNIEKLPEIKFKTIDNVSHSITDLSEPIIFLHFWASWCSTCKVEFPELLELIQNYGGQIALVSISIDKEQDKMQQGLDSFQKQLPDKAMNDHIYWVWDGPEKNLANRFAVKKVPETIFVNQKRMMMDKTVGKTDWLGEDIKQIISSSLGSNSEL
jgi:thiol-disulfide isomerase/thioredoxin